MTVGFWHDEAHRSLRAAADAMRSAEVSSTVEVHAAIAARSDILGGLARVTELLVGGRPSPDASTRAAAAQVLGRPGPALSRLYVGLQAAAATGERRQPTPPEATGVALPLRRAADAVGVIGDIIASHVPPPQQRPRTPEGAAVRAGGGVQAALGDVARLTVDALLIDSRLPAWVARAQPPMAATYGATVDAARWITSSRLGAVARDLINEVAGRPALIRELDLARAPLDPAPAVTSAAEAAAALKAARTWLWQNPGFTTATHLQAATQLGLALHLLDGGADLEARQNWRDAARTATGLRGTPAVGPARDAGAELMEVLRWARAQLGRQGGASTVDRPGQFAGELATLAGTLHTGIRHAVQRHDLFVRSDILRRPAGKMIYMATERWRPARLGDDLIRDLSGSLFLAQGAPGAGAWSGAKHATTAEAFPHPPKPGRAISDSPGPAEQPPGTSHRRGR